MYIDAIHNTFTDSYSTILWTHACLWLVNLHERKGRRSYNGSQCKSNTIRVYDRSRPIVTFPPGRSQPIRGCSIGNSKQTEQNEVNKEKRNEFGKVGKINEVWENGKMEKWKESEECWILQMHWILLEIKIYNKTFLVWTQVSVSTIHFKKWTTIKHTIRTKCTSGIDYNTGYTTKTKQNCKRKELQNLE